LKKYLQRLEETIAERTTEFTKQNIELKQSNIEQQKTKSGLNLKSVMLEKAPEIILLTDFAGIITYVNEAGRRIFDLEEPKSPGTNLSESAISGVKKIVSSVSGELSEKRQLKYEAPFTRRDGTTVQLEVHSCIIETAYGDRVLSIVHDITK
jgi:PAS domain S-box-containing protein